MSEQGLLTVREVAALLGFGSEDPVRRLVRSGRLRAHKVSGRIRISRGAVDELLAASVVEPVARPVLARAEVVPARRVQAAGGGVLPWERRRRAGKAA
jgi:excisionase family DNA binding protein